MPEPTTVVCPNCGTPAEPGTQFCASCGAELPMPDEPQADGRAPRAWWIIGGIALALIIAGTAAFLLLGDDESVTTDDVVLEPGEVETSLPATTTEPTTTQPTADGDTAPAPTPPTESPSATTTAGSAPTTSPEPAPSAAPEPAPTDRSEEAAGLVGQAIEDCAGLQFVDTTKGFPTGDDSIYRVEARFVWDDSEPWTGKYTVDVDSSSITPADSEAARMICQ